LFVGVRQVAGCMSAMHPALEVVILLLRLIDLVEDAAIGEMRLLDL
jgi:hypothetical protein